MHSHECGISCNNQLTVMLDYLEMHDTRLRYGMVNSQILVQLLSWVLMRVPSDCEDVPFPSCAYIHLLDALMCSIMCTNLEVIPVLVWLILEYFSLASIFVPRVAKKLHLLEAWSFSDFLDNLPWLQSSSIVPRRLLMWLFVVALNELLSKVVILGCTIPFGDLHELDALASQ